MATWDGQGRELQAEEITQTRTRARKEVGGEQGGELQKRLEKHATGQALEGLEGHS